MSVFSDSGYGKFWTIYGDEIIDVDDSIVAPVIEKLGGLIDIRFPMGANSYACVLFCRALEIEYDYQELSTPLEITVSDRYPQCLLGSFTPQWGKKESRDRFEQFLRAIV